MCGIAGLIGRAPVSRQQLVTMADTLAHRGPDDAGVWTSADGMVGFAHRRLAIVDLSPAGAQPMTSADRRWTICLNGEIYNHREVRRACEAAGFAQWRGHSDTETLIEAIALFGLGDTLERSAGMFAFALFDAVDRSVTLVRDRFGEKPLYYGRVGQQIAFASELKAIADLPSFDRSIDPVALDGMLRTGAVPAARSIYRDVRKVPPGATLRFAAGQVGALPAPERYWRHETVLAEGLNDPFQSREAAVDALDQALGQAIGDQAMADVPVGAFLSGGIDSSAVVALYRKHGLGQIRTFSIGFAEAGYNEADDARRVAEHLGTEHHERIVTADDALAVIPRLPTMYDEPFADSSQIPTHLVSAFAREQVTVALSGDGGDELFGGYNRYTGPARLWDRLRTLPTPLRQALAGGGALVPPAVWRAARERVSGRAGDPQFGAKLQRTLRAMAGSDDVAGVQAVLTDQWASAGAAPTEAAIEASAFADRPDWPAALNMMARDVQSYLPDDILVKVDRAAMACSLETRAPLLDHRVAAVAARIPTAMNIVGGTGKTVLRELLYRHVPRALLDRPKVGFAIPIGAWLRGPLRDWAEALLTPAELARTPQLNAPAIRERWARHLRDDGDHAAALWAVLMYQGWRARWVA